MSKAWRAAQGEEWVLVVEFGNEGAGPIAAEVLGADGKEVTSLNVQQGAGSKVFRYPAFVGAATVSVLATCEFATTLPAPVFVSVSQGAVLRCEDPAGGQVINQTGEDSFAPVDMGSLGDGETLADSFDIV